MTSLLTFTVPTAPVAMARPRVTVRGGRAHGYVPAKTQQAAWEIRQSAIAALGDDPPFAGPVALRVTAYVPVPKSLPKRLHGIARPTKRPDIDNLLKTVLDGCSPLWGDDSQVVDLRGAKVFAIDGPPRWSITVEDLARLNCSDLGAPTPTASVSSRRDHRRAVLPLKTDCHSPQRSDP